MTLAISTTISLISLSNHPISFIVALILLTISLAIKSFTLTKMSLFSYIIILILLGGLIVLFIYMATLAPNEPFHKISKWPMISLILVNSITIMMFFPQQINHMTLIKINSLLLSPTWLTLIMSYLLISMIAIVKITLNIQGPLRAIGPKINS